MPRRLKVQTREMGMLELYLIYNEGGLWEEEWRPLQTYGDLVEQMPCVSKEQMEHALIGWTRPLIDALGPAPKGLLLKLPLVTRECCARETCPFFRPKDCISLSKRAPWCFQPNGIADLDVRKLAAEVIKMWREGVYTVVVLEATTNAQ